VSARESDATSQVCATRFIADRQMPRLSGSLRGGENLDEPEPIFVPSPTVAVSETDCPTAALVAWVEIVGAALVTTDGP
jgi:hypothetical protein